MKQSHMQSQGRAGIDRGSHSGGEVYSYLIVLSIVKSATKERLTRELTDGEL